MPNSKFSEGSRPDVSENTLVFGIDNLHVRYWLLEQIEVWHTIAALREFNALFTVHLVYQTRLHLA